MEKYNKPEIEIISFSSEDVLTASDDFPTPIE